MGNNGGARPGAGRKKGERDTRTKRLQTMAAAGRDPFEVFLLEMNYHVDRFEAAEADDVKTKTQALVLARKAAKEAMPYIRAKLKAITVTQMPVDLSKLTEAQLAELEHLIRAASATGHDDRGNRGGEETTRH